MVTKTERVPLKYETPQYSIDNPEMEASLSIDNPEKKRPSDPGKQFIAGISDIGTGIPMLGALAYAGAVGGLKGIGNDKGFGTNFADTLKDSYLMKKGLEGRDWVNESLDIKNPVSTEDQAARLLGSFVAPPGMQFIGGASKAAGLARGTFNVLTPAVKMPLGFKKGFTTKAGLKNYGMRSGTQAGLGTGIEQGIRALSDDPNMPMMFSEKALTGKDPKPDSMEMTSTTTSSNTNPAMLSIDNPETQMTMPTTLSINNPEQTLTPFEQEQIANDKKMEEAKDFSSYTTAAALVAAIMVPQAIGRYMKGDKFVAPWTKKPEPTQREGSYIYEQGVDANASHANALKEQGHSAKTVEDVTNTDVSDLGGVAAEVGAVGKYAHGFPNSKFRSHSDNVIDNDEIVLSQARNTSGVGGETKADLFNAAMKAQSELSMRAAGRSPSLWGKNTGDKELQDIVTAARGDKDIDNLMIKHAENYRASLEYEVHRGLTTRADADALIKMFSVERTVNGVKRIDSTYSPFYGKTEQNMLAKLANKFLGFNTKAGDELLTVKNLLARGQGSVDELLTASQSMKKYRNYHTIYINDQLYKNNILTKLAGIRINKTGQVIPQRLDANGQTVDAKGFPKVEETGRGTEYLGESVDDLSRVTDPNSIKVRKTSDGTTSSSVNDLRGEFGKEIVTVHHQGKLHVYRVPDAGVRASLSLTPQLGGTLHFMNHWKNVFTQLTTGKYSLFAPMSALYSAGQIALTTSSRAKKGTGVADAFYSIGRSAKGINQFAIEQGSLVISNYLATSIAKGTAIGRLAPQFSAKWAEKLRDRYESSILALVRGQTGRTATGIGSEVPTVNKLLDDYGLEMMNFYGKDGLIALKNVWTTFVTAANEGPAYGAMLKELGKLGRVPNVKEVRKAVELSKDLAGDMTRKGASGAARAFDASIPFSAAMIQSWNAIGTAAKNDWKRFSAGAAALIGAPTMAELGMVHSLSATGQTYRDAEGREWTYADYYWNGLTTDQRNNNLITMLPGKPPWEAILIPIAPEWSLFKAVSIESADALFGLSDIGDIGRTSKNANQTGRDHFIGALVRVLGLPLPPLADGILSSMGLDVRAGFNVGDLPTKEAPGQTVNFLQNYKVGMGERITSGGGRTKAVNGILDQNTAATIQAIFGAAGSMYVSFVESAGGAMKAEDGTLAKGISAGLESLTTNSLRSARYLQPLLGKAISPTSSGEIQRALYTKRQSMLSLNKDFDVLMTRGLVHIDGRPVDGNSIIPTQDPIRQDLAAASKTVTGHINEEDERIAYQRKRLSTLENATDQGTYRQKRDKIDAIKLEIQTLKASQLAKIHQYEDHWSARLSEKYGRNIRIDLSGGYGKTIAARPNLEGSKMREFPK